MYSLTGVGRLPAVGTLTTGHGKTLPATCALTTRPDITREALLIWRILRRLIAILVRTLFTNRILTIVAVIIILFVAGVVASGTLQGGSTGLNSQFPSANPVLRFVQPVTSEPPAPAVDSYLKGMTNFDAELMWSAFSSEYLKNMQSRGGTKELLQQNLSEAKRRGAKYDEISYIGSYRLNTGSKYFFYVVGRRGFSANAPDAVEQIYYVFTVDSQGTIVSVD